MINGIDFESFTKGAESLVLGSIIQEGELIEKSDLLPSDFYATKHQTIFATMQDMHRRGVPIDISTLCEEIKRSGREEETGGFAYLSYLVESTPSTAAFPYYVQQIKEARRRRDLLKLLNSVQQIAANGGSMEDIQTEVSKLVQLMGASTERPEMKQEAFYGLAGEIVDLISPHSEADPVALLANFLTAYGNVIGDQAFFRVEADKHPCRLFCILVGDTSKGRKGTSWGYIKALFENLEPEWVKKIQTGLSSGEGLIWAVRDKITKRQPVRENNRVVDYEEIIVDEGVKDKRLLVVEGEFTSTLKVIERDGNILSPIIRCAWDSGDLQILTKNSPAKATGAHISIIGHITKEELTRYLSTTEAGNGFGNRFLFLYVKRSKTLPYGGGFHKENLEPVLKKLKAVIEFGKKAEEISWAEETKPLWEAVYPSLSDGKPGLIGALTARAEAYVTRLACIYALLDLSTEIKREHLKAALAVWEYAEASVKFIFRNSSGIPLVNEIQEALREKPMTRTDLYNYFKRNKSSAQIQEALKALEAGGKLVREIIKTDGRSKTVWYLNET